MDRPGQQTGVKFPPLHSVRDSIRLLLIRPGAQGEPIQCSFQVVTLDDRPHYAALSYAWNHDKAERQILVHGEPANVSDNVFHALHRLRHPVEQKAIWIDALCINQADTIEKTAQVDMMQRIYSQCSICYIWMGQLDDGMSLQDAQRAFDALRVLSSESDLPPTLFTDDELSQAGKVLMRFMHLPWWARIWTVQEAIFPTDSEILWGPLSVPWHALRQAAHHLVQGHPDRHSIHRRIFNKKNDGSGWLTAPVIWLVLAQRDLEYQRPSPLFMLWRFRYRLATDPRDKIYAVPGLIKGSHPLLPSVPSCDYGRDVIELFTRVTVDLIRDSGGLLPLIGWRQTSRMNGLPSWVADWAPRDSGRTLFYCHRWFYDNLFAADKAFPGFELETFNRTADYPKLHLRGIFIDRIVTVSPNIPEDNPFSCLSFLPEMLSSAADETELSLHSRATLPKRLGQLVTGSFLDKSKVFEGYPADGAWREYMLCDHVLFITATGFVGVCNGSAEVGDGVWVVAGSRVPFVLRQAQTKTESGGTPPEYMFVGDGYVPGLMDGEAVESALGHPQAIDIV